MPSVQAVSGSLRARTPRTRGVMRARTTRICSNTNDAIVSFDRASPVGENCKYPCVSGKTSSTTLKKQKTLERKQL